MQFASRAMITKIHVLKSKLGIPEEHYRDMLAGYNVCSSTNLSFENGKDFIRKLEERATERGIPAHRNPPRDMATPGQIALVKRLWEQVSRQETESKRLIALNNFIAKKWKISRIEWLPSEIVPKIVRTLKAMGAGYAG